MMPATKVWSDEEEEYLLKLYCEEQMDIFDIAREFKRNHRSVISKLVQLRVYQKPEKAKRRSVKSMIFDLEEMLNIKIDGLNLSKKNNLEKVVDSIREIVQEQK